MRGVGVQPRPRARRARPFAGRAVVKAKSMAWHRARLRAFRCLPTDSRCSTWPRPVPCARLGWRRPRWLCFEGVFAARDPRVVLAARPWLHVHCERPDRHAGRPQTHQVPQRVFLKMNSGITGWLRAESFRSPWTRPEPRCRKVRLSSLMTHSRCPRARGTYPLSQIEVFDRTTQDFPCARTIANIAALLCGHRPVLADWVRAASFCTAARRISPLMTPRIGNAPAGHDAVYEAHRGARPEAGDKTVG